MSQHAENSMLINIWSVGSDKQTGKLNVPVRVSFFGWFHKYWYKYLSTSVALQWLKPDVLRLLYPPFTSHRSKDTAVALSEDRQKVLLVSAHFHYRVKQHLTTFTTILLRKSTEAKRAAVSSVSPSSSAWVACASLLFLSNLWHSSRRCFWTFASSHSPASIRRWSGRMRLSVGAIPSSDSLRVSAKEEKKYMFSALSLWNEGQNTMRRTARQPKRTQERREEAKLKGKCLRWRKPTEVGISSRAVWVEASGKPSSVCIQSLHIPGCCPLSLHFPSCHPMSLTGYNGLWPLCPLPLRLPGDQRRGQEGIDYKHAPTAR